MSEEVLNLSDVDALWRVRDLWLSAAADSLADCGRPVGRLTHSPGVTTTWDECCKGMLYTRLVSVEPMISAQNTGKTFTHPRRVVATVVCGVIRCTPVLGENGEIPTSEEITLNAAEVEQDMWAVLKAAENIDRDYKIMRWNPVGPAGGCAGGEWTIQVILPPCADCVSLEG